MYMKGATRQIKSLTLRALQSIAIRQAEPETLGRASTNSRLPCIRRRQGFHTPGSNPVTRLVEHMDVFGRGREGHRFSRRRRVPAANFGHHQFVVGAAHMGV
jgi:hypothetical protein